MATYRHVVAAGIALVASAGCVHNDQTVDTYFPEPTVIAGPPGGAMDPGWGAGYPAGDASYPATGQEMVASADPAAPGYVMGEVSDVEIDATLEGYGEWVEIDGYGDVWRPYATEVGVDFTPYETCGSWVWTDDWGWVYGCDWDWGWLPFHYGQWGWFDDYWAWVPDYEWSPAWVEWRGGGGYVGWRPQAPVVRDHRHHHQGPVVRDHRTHHGLQSVPRIAVVRDSQWRFAAAAEFGKPHIRSHLFKNPAEGLRVTSLATRPPFRGTVQPVKAASVMRGRLASLASDSVAGEAGRAHPRGRNVGAPSALDGAYVRGAVQPGGGGAWTRRAPSFGAQESDDNASVFAPGIAPNTQGAPVRGGTSGEAIDPPYEDGGRSGGPNNLPGPAGDVDPSQGATPQPDPSRDDASGWQPATPARPTWNTHEQSTWQPAQPARPSWNTHQESSWQPAQPSRPSSSWSPPSRPSSPPSSWQPAQPSRPSSSWSPPSRPSSPPSSWQPAQPSHSSSSSSWSPPSHSSGPSGSSGSWSAPSHSASPPSHSSSPPPSHSSGGGGRHH